MTRLQSYLFGFFSLVVIFLVNTTIVLGASDIKIGLLSPMKFPVGKIHRDSATLAVEEINKEGGILVQNEKRKIKLIQVDSNEFLSIIDAVNAMERLITINKADFILGGVRSEAAMAMLEIAADNKKVFVSIGAASPKLPMLVAKDYDRYKYYFRGASANSIFQGQYIFIHLEAVAKNIRNKLGIKTPKVAIIAEKALWADPIVAAAEKTLPKMGMESVGAWRPSATSSDLTAELASVKRKGAQIILFFAAGPVDVTISKQVGELKIPALVVGTSIDATTQEHWEITEGQCNYRMIGNTAGNVEITKNSKVFWEKFKNRFNRFPAQYTSAVFDSFYAIKYAVEKAGTIDSDSVVSQLEKMDFPGASGRYAFYSTTDKFPHDRRYGPDYAVMLATQWQDGELKVVWPDGQIAGGDERWIGVRYKGTVELQLPPWMISYWKNR